MASESTSTRLNWGLSPIAFDGSRTPEKAVLFLVLCMAWVLPGLVGHDPWKSDEAIVFGAVTEMLRSGDWVAFRVAGEPLLDKPPLMLWVSASLAHAFGGWLALHDAARLASGVFMSITLGALTLAARELLGERALRMTVLLFIGCLGLLIRAHELTTDLAGLSGMALGIYGLALAHRRPVAGGVITGVGLGIAFLGDGFLPVAALLAALAMLPAVSKLWRTPAYALTAGTAVACALPLIAIWPALLAATHPDLLQAWFHAAAALPGPEEPFAAGYLLSILPWHAWPAWPLAAWTLYRARRDLHLRRGLMLPTVVLGAFFVVIGLFGETHEVNALPLLLPLAILGVAELDNVPRGAAGALDWFGMTTFFLFALLIWIGWTAAMTGQPEFARDLLQREAPGFVYRFNPLAVALAAMLTLIWLAVVARSLRSTRRALVNWSAGITMVWVLVMTLGVPLVDRARSYRSVAGNLAAALPPDGGCIARRGVGDAQRALLDYFAGLRTVAEDDPAAAACGLLLLQVAPNRIASPGAPWHEVWRGARPADRNETFLLYRRDAARDSTTSIQ
jgi:4-amino-4-deoxy-L-arabinose transferase-like glycosyltransferase